MITEQDVKYAVYAYIEKEFRGKLTNREIQSLKNSAPDMMCAKWDVPTYIHSFAECLAKNDLQGAIGRADHINARLLKEYMIIWNCCPYPAAE